MITYIKCNVISTTNLNEFYSIKYIQLFIYLFLNYLFILIPSIYC